MSKATLPVKVLNTYCIVSAILKLSSANASNLEKAKILSYSIELRGGGGGGHKLIQIFPFLYSGRLTRTFTINNKSNIMIIIPDRGLLYVNNNKLPSNSSSITRPAFSEQSCRSLLSTYTSAMGYMTRILSNRGKRVLLPFNCFCNIIKWTKKIRFRIH